MTVHRPQIRNPHVLKQHARDHQLFKAALCPADPVDGTVASLGSLQRIINSFFQIQIAGSSTDIIQILGHTAHIFGNGHIIVI